MPPLPFAYVPTKSKPTHAELSSVPAAGGDSDVSLIVTVELACPLFKLILSVSVPSVVASATIGTVTVLPLPTTKLPSRGTPISDACTPVIV